jgi:hypothetical protein
MRTYRDQYMLSNCRRFRTTNRGGIAKLLIAKECASVLKGRQMTQLRHIQTTMGVAVVISLVCPVVCATRELPFVIVLTKCSGTVSHFFSCTEKQSVIREGEACREMIGSRSVTKRKSTFDLAYCRAFETLHRLYSLSYNCVRIRVDVRIAKSCVKVWNGSRVQRLPSVGKAWTVIALTVRWSLRVHYCI